MKNSKQTPSLTRAWSVVMIASLFFFFEFINMNSFDSLNVHLRTAFDADSIQISHLSAMYFYANVIFLIPAGLILDRCSTKACLLIAVLVCTLSDIAFSLTDSMTVAQVCRFVTGMGSTFCLLSCAKLTSQWFPNKLAGLVMGLVVTNAMIGGMLAQYTGALANYLDNDWRLAMQMIALLGGVIFLIMVCGVKDTPNPKGQNQEHKKLHDMGFWQSLRLSFKNGQTWLAGLYTNLMSIPITVLGGLWASEYLQISFKFSQHEASAIAIMIFLGMMVGSPLSGWISDKLERRRAPMIYGALLTFAVSLVIMVQQTPTFWEMCALFLLLGFFSSTQVITYALVIESNPKYLTASSESLSASIIMASGAVFQPLFGWLMTQGFEGSLSAGEKIYSKASFDMAMWLFPVAFAISLLLAFLIRETRCRAVPE